MGKHAAVLAGYPFVTGKYVINLDDDGQCPVYELWNLVEPIENDECDVCTAEYFTKKQKWWKNLGSSFNASIISLMLNKPKNMKLENFCVLKRFVIDEMIKYTNPFPYLEGLIFRTTDRIKSVKMEERTRCDSLSTGYTLIKSIDLFINGLTAFSVKPLRISTLIGVITALIGFVWAIVLLIKRLCGLIVVAGFASTVIIQLILGGLILMSLGLIGEYIGRIYISINKSPQYVIKNTVNCK